MYGTKLSITKIPRYYCGLQDWLLQRTAIQLVQVIEAWAKHPVFGISRSLSSAGLLQVKLVRLLVIHCYLLGSARHESTLLLLKDHGILMQEIYTLRLWGQSCERRLIRRPTYASTRQWNLTGLLSQFWLIRRPHKKLNDNQIWTQKIDFSYFLSVNHIKT